MGLIFISFSFGRILFLLGEWRERLIKISREIIHCSEGVDAMGSVCAFIPMIGRRVKHRLVHQGDVSILRLLRPSRSGRGRLGSSLFGKLISQGWPAPLQMAILSVSIFFSLLQAFRAFKGR